MSRFDKYFYSILLVFIVYVTIGFKLIPYILEDQIVKNINKNLNLNATLKNVDFNPFIFKLQINELILKNKEKETISFNKMVFNLEVFKSLANKQINIHDLYIDGFYINVHENNDGSFNFQNFVKAKKSIEEKQEDRKQKSQIDFHINYLALKNSNVLFTKENYSLNIHDINYEIFDLDSQKISSNIFSLKINEHTILQMQAGLNIKPFSFDGNLKISDLRLKEVVDYKKEILNFSLNDKANFNTDINFKISMNDKLQVLLNESNINLNEIKLSQNNKIISSTKNILINNFNLNLLKKEVLIDNFTFNNELLNIIKNKESLNLATLVKKTNKQNHKTNEDNSKQKTPNPWKINLKSLKFSMNETNYKDEILKNKISSNNNFIHIKDAFLKENIFVKQINFQNKRTSLINKDIDLEVKNTQAKLFSLALNSDDINFSIFQFNKENLFLNNKKEKSKLYLKDLNILAKNFSKEKDLISLKESYISNPKINFILEKNKKKKVDNKKEEKNNSKKGKTKLNIGPIKIKDVLLSFEDKNLPLEFKSKIHSLNGEISALDTRKASKSDLNLKGLVNKYGLAKITGVVDPNDIKILTDISVKLNNIAINDFSAYSAKFIGRKIDEGKLDIDLKYNIKKSNLDANNSIVITKIKFGDDVKSDTALSLPIGLAIALLEDSEGVIDLNVPVSGNIDDPKFEVTPIIWMALKNIITKAATAPFKLLGSLFGFEEDEIKKVAFNYGENNVGVIQKEPLDKLVKILKGKKKLKISIKPTFNELLDTKALKKMTFNTLLKKALPNRHIKDYDKKYLSFLEKAYKKDLSKIKKDKNYKNILEKAYLESIVISKNDLISLAKKRVKNIEKYLDKKINKNQIEILNDIENISTKDKKLNIEIKLKSNN